MPQTLRRVLANFRWYRAHRGGHWERWRIRWDAPSAWDMAHVDEWRPAEWCTGNAGNAERPQRGTLVACEHYWS